MSGAKPTFVPGRLDKISESKERGETWMRYKIREEYAQDEGGKQVNPKKTYVDILGLGKWVKGPDDKYHAFLVDGKDPVPVSNDTDDHKIESGLVNFRVTKDGLQYLDSSTGKTKATERIRLKTTSGETVKPSFARREIETKKIEDPKEDVEYHLLTIKEFYNASIDGKKGDVVKILKLWDGVPLRHDVEVIPAELIKSVSFVWTLEEGDSLEIATEKGPRKEDLKTKEPIDNQNFLSVRILQNDKLFLGESTARNKDFLQTIQRNFPDLEWVYRPRKGKALVEEAQTWETTNPNEDGYVKNGDGQRYGSQVTTCAAANDIYIETPGPYKRAYFEYDTSALANMASTSPATFLVTKVEFICEVKRGDNAKNCDYVGRFVKPTSTSCPGGGTTIYNDMDSANNPSLIVYISSNSQTGLVGRNRPITLGDVSGANACVDVQNSATGPAPPKWFVFGMKANPEDATAFQPIIKGEEYPPTMVYPRPKLKVTYSI